MEKIFAALGGTTKVVDIVVKLVIAVIIFFFLRSLYIKWKRRNAGKQWVDPTELNPNTNYDNLAKSVHDAFDNFWNSGEDMDSTCSLLNALNNNELREVNNRYLAIYGKNTRTLQDAVTDYKVCLSCDNCVALQERLKTIGIN